MPATVALLAHDAGESRADLSGVISTETSFFDGFILFHAACPPPPLPAVAPTRRLYRRRKKRHRCPDSAPAFRRQPADFVLPTPPTPDTAPPYRLRHHPAPPRLRFFRRREISVTATLPSPVDFAIAASRSRSTTPDTGSRMRGSLRRRDLPNPPAFGLAPPVAATYCSRHPARGVRNHRSANENICAAATPGTATRLRRHYRNRRFRKRLNRAAELMRHQICPHPRRHRWLASDNQLAIGWSRRLHVPALGLSPDRGTAALAQATENRKIRRNA